MKILANDGIDSAAIEALQASGFEVITTNVAQEQLINYINTNKIDALLVRSATKVRKDLIDATKLKLIGRGGVGMDNIDVDYAKSKGIHVINTPAASSHSVAELVFAHLFGMVRFLYDSNRTMPLDGDTKFNALKKAYANGRELKGKTMGVFGIGRIGQETSKIALGVGMKVIAFDPFIEKVHIDVDFFDGQKIGFDIKTQTKESVLKEADFISFHVPAQKDYVISTTEFNMMKTGVGIVNASRGGVIDEVALVTALESGKVAYAAIDTFENEPTPALKLLMMPNISLTPHIGAATLEAQERIGLELAEIIVKLLK